MTPDQYSIPHHQIQRPNHTGTYNNGKNYSLNFLSVSLFQATY